MTIFKKAPIRNYMTPMPHVIGCRQRLLTAAQRMRRLGVRHLPVLDGDRLVGIVSDRDVAVVNSGGGGADGDSILVGDAMTPAPFSVGPEMPLSAVARAMAAHRVGSVVVVREGEVVGILTSTDTAELFADMLVGYLGTWDEEMRPSAVRERILREHQVLRETLDQLEDLCERALCEEPSAIQKIPLHARELYRLLRRHLDLEARILAPALRESGPRGVARAELLALRHARQRRSIEEAIARLDLGEVGAPQLAASLLDLVPRVRAELEAEEEHILIEALFEDGPVRADLFTG